MNGSCNYGTFGAWRHLHYAFCSKINMFIPQYKQWTICSYPKAGLHWTRKQINWYVLRSQQTFFERTFMIFRQHLNPVSWVKHVQHGTFLERKKFLWTKREFHWICPTAFAENTSVVFVKCHMKRNPQSIHHVHHQHRQNDILYNKQLPLMNEVIETKPLRKYISI